MTRVSYIDCSGFMQGIPDAEAPDRDIAVHLGDPVDLRDLRARIGGAEAVLNGHTTLDATMMDGLPALRRIVFLGTGAGSYSKLDNSVDRAGFATTQVAYEKAFDDVFAMLDKLEHRLGDGRG